MAEEETTDEVVEGQESAPSESASINENSNLKWYVINAYSGYEDKARLALLERIKKGGVESHFGEILVPKKVTEKILASGKKKLVEKVSYPGYVLVQMQLDESTLHVVTDTPKITGFVGNARNPRPLSDQEVLRFTSPESVERAAEPAQVEVLFEKGETVKVKDGPFTNFDGLVDEVRPEKMKLKILVSIFGRETPVELDYNQVEKIT